MKKLLKKLITVDGMILVDIKTAKGVYGGSESYDSCVSNDESVSYDTSEYADVSHLHDGSDNG